MASDTALNFITREFLESHIGHKVTGFLVEDGTKPGDNFMSVLYSICVGLQKSSGEEETVHLFLKCYPSHPSRQEFLNKANLFYNEVSFYTKLAKDLATFQSEIVGLNVGEIVTPAFPPFFGGKAINYSQAVSQEEESRVYSPLDNYILMTDLHKSLAFQMADSKIGLGVDHMKLAFKELATMHALSWAYKKHVKVNLAEKFPFLKKSTNPNKTKMWLGLLAENANTAVAAIDSTLGVGNNLSKSVKKFTENAETIIHYFSTQEESLEKSLRGKLRKHHNLEADFPIWRVVCHGDCWINNLLFEYNQITKVPVRAILIDFPLAKLGCPTLDLSCLIYTSTRKQFRQACLHSCLQLYHQRFLEICSVLKVEETELPPQFTVAMLTEKFHVSKLVGFLIALLSLPLNLIDSKEDANFEKKDAKSTLADMLQEASASGGKTSLYKEWIVELVQEMYNENVI